jgi:hypothetical protein
MALNRVLYHAERGWYSLQKRLGLLTSDEYLEKKRFLRQRFPPKLKGAGMNGHKGSEFRRNFGEYIDENSGTLHEKCLRLVDGLDNESCAVVDRILSRLMRLHRMRGRRGKVTRLFEMAPSEARALERTGGFDSKAIGFPNGVHAYNKMLLPHWCVPAESLLDRHFTEELGLAPCRG